MAIKVIGATCSLGEAVIDKLLSLDVDVIAVERSHVVRNHSVLKYTKSKIFTEGDGFSLSFDSTEADIVVGKDIIVNDLIPTRIDKWLAPEIEHWLAGQEYVGRPRFWVSVLDAAHAIAHIANCLLYTSPSPRD